MFEGIDLDAIGYDGYQIVRNAVFINKVSLCDGTQRNKKIKPIEHKPVYLDSGPLRESLKNQARELEIEDSVAFLGTRDDVADILGASDLFVLPSSTESMPGALMEAGFAGLSSVSYNVGAISDVIDYGISGLKATIW